VSEEEERGKTGISTDDFIAIGTTLHLTFVHSGLVKKWIICYVHFPQLAQQQQQQQEEEEQEGGQERDRQEDVADGDVEYSDDDDDMPITPEDEEVSGVIAEALTYDLLKLLQTLFSHYLIAVQFMFMSFPQMNTLLLELCRARPDDQQPQDVPMLTPQQINTVCRRIKPLYLGQVCDVAAVYQLQLDL